MDSQDTNSCDGSEFVDVTQTHELDGTTDITHKNNEEFLKNLWTNIYELNEDGDIL